LWDHGLQEMGVVVRLLLKQINLLKLYAGIFWDK